MALLLASSGEIERAVELYAWPHAIPLGAESHWFSGVTGSRLAAVAATLPGDQVTGLQERCRKRDLDATVSELLADLCK